MAHAHAKNVHTVIKIWLQMLNFHLPSTYLTYLQKVPNHDTQSYSVCYLNKSSKWQKRQMHGTSELGEWVTSLFIYLRYGRKDTVMRNAHIFISIFLVFSLPYVYEVWRTKYICVVECAAPRGMKGVNLSVHCSTVYPIFPIKLLRKLLISFCQGWGKY